MSENAMFGQCAQCGSTLTNGHQCAPRKVFVRPGSNQALYDEAFELLKRACELLLAARDKHESATAQETEPVLKCIHGVRAYARCIDCENDQTGFRPAQNR